MELSCRKKGDGDDDEYTQKWKILFGCVNLEDCMCLSSMISSGIALLKGKCEARVVGALS